MIKAYRPSEIDPRHETHKIALMLESNEVNKRLSNERLKMKDGKPTFIEKKHFIATYEKFNHDLLTGEKADMVTKLKDNY
ncbi:MAG: hypothetical protein R3F02_06300 [Thiolinea sp.]